MNYVAEGTATSVSGGVIWTLEISLLRSDSSASAAPEAPEATTYTERGPLIATSSVLRTTGTKAIEASLAGWARTSDAGGTTTTNGDLIFGSPPAGALGVIVAAEVAGTEVWRSLLQAPIATIIVYVNAAAPSTYVQSRADGANWRLTNPTRGTNTYPANTRLKVYWGGVFAETK